MACVQRRRWQTQAVLAAIWCDHRRSNSRPLSPSSTTSSLPPPSTATSHRRHLSSPPPVAARNTASTHYRRFAAIDHPTPSPPPPVSSSSQNGLAAPLARATLHEQVKIDAAESESGIRQEIRTGRSASTVRVLERR